MRLFAAIHLHDFFLMYEACPAPWRSWLPTLHQMTHGQHSCGATAFDGKSAIQVREATAAQHAQWKRSRDQAISHGEIDLDAGNNPDEWNVYLLGTSRTDAALWA